MKKYILLGLSLLLALTYSCKKDNEDLKVVASKIIVNPSAVYLKAGGDVATVKAYALPKSPETANIGIKWTVEDNKIATINEKGIITPLTVGTTNVIATSDNNIKATCAVNITKEIIMVTKLEMSGVSDKGLFIVVDDNKTINVTITPNNATSSEIEWESSNEDVAIVEEGVVTALKAGKASISAIASNGVKSKCYVTVSDKDILASSIAITYNSKIINEVEGIVLKEKGTKVLNASILPENTTNTNVVWTSSDELKATVAKTGELTALMGGDVIITATTSNGIEAKCKVIIDPIIWAKSMTVVGKEIMAIDSEQVLEVAFLPINAENEDMIFTSSDDKIATVDVSGTVKAISAGSVVITVVTEKKVTATFNITVEKGTDPFVFDGKTYKTVKAGALVWMSENLAYLPTVNKLTDTKEKVACYYVYDYSGEDVTAAKAVDNYTTYGVLYNFVGAVSALTAANADATVKSDCPKGWRIPSHEDWKALEKAFGMLDSELNDDSYKGRGSIGKKFKSTRIWDPAGTNDTGLDILPAGYLNEGYGDSSKNKFTQKEGFAKIWSSSTSKSLKSYAYCRGFKSYGEQIVANNCPKKTAMSVRFVRDIKASEK
ncbi:MAG: Ig-like domain-containing protein [Marinifilaceae bacterium]